LSGQQLNHLRQSAREIFNAALRAVDAHELTRRAIHLNESRVRVVETDLRFGRPIYVLSIGKAAASMSLALDESLGDRIAAGLVTCPTRCESLPSKWRQFASGHPLPNSESLSAAQAAFELLEKADSEKAVVIFAVSGGGSAMVEWPIDDSISLSDLQNANRLLVQCGANIAEINTVRRAFSAVKGGKLASRAPNAQIVTLIISDTNPGDEASVASGPSVAPLAVTTTASEIVRKFELEGKLPQSILRAIRESKGIESYAAIHPCYVIGDMQTAINAAVEHARSLGFNPIVASDILEQPIAEGSELLLERLASDGASDCLISGGEFACTVQGSGQGGRNLETALLCAIELNQSSQGRDMVVLSGGTDGVDGNSPATGAIADETTLTRARALNLDASDFLSRSDSYSFFKKLGDAIVTGPTGTNVRDLRICLRS